MSERNAIKIVVDTNIWISFLIGRSLDPLVDAIKTKNIEVYFSQELYEELFTVMTREKFTSQISEEKIAEIREVVGNKVKTVIPDCVVTDCRDPKDNFLLELAISVGAHYLITGDSDLLELDPFYGVRILKVRDFERILASC